MKIRFYFLFLSCCHFCAWSQDDFSEKICLINLTGVTIDVYRTTRDPSINPSKVLQYQKLSGQSLLNDLPRRPFPGFQETGTMLICGSPTDICDPNTNAMALAEINDSDQGNCGEKCELKSTGVNSYTLTCTAAQMVDTSYCSSVCTMPTKMKKGSPLSRG